MRHKARRLLASLFLTLSLSADAVSETGKKIVAVAQRHNLDAHELTLAVESVRTTGKLPEKWITKSEAQRLGWRPGIPLNRIAPGKSIGGDRFGNRERRLPAAQGRVYYEADLQYRGGRRNAKRLVFSNDRLFYVTVDHYKTFERLAP